MHILIPYAAPPGPQCQQALRNLELPALAALLPLLRTESSIEGTQDQLSPVHERIHARALGWDDADGLLPWAAHTAKFANLPADEAGWAWVTPCHWQIHADHVVMDHPENLGLTVEESETLRTAMQPFFAEDGVTLYAMQTEKSTVRWLAQGEILRDLPTASLSRACGGKVDAWMPRGPQARSLRRLQNEMQMLLYRHPINDARVARGKLPVNSFWMSGTGSLPSDQSQSNTHILVADDLQSAALRDDAKEWTAAWSSLDASEITKLLACARTSQTFTLTLCSEHRAVTYGLHQTPWWRQWRPRWARSTPSAVLTAL
jgi:hypothetical protein